MKKLFVTLLLSAAAHAAPCRVLNFTDFQGITTLVSGLSEGSSRSCLFVQNKGATGVLIQVSTSAQGALNGVSVASGSTWEPANPPTNQIFIRPLAGATASVYIHDGIK